MVRKELRKLNRRELIEIIYQMKKNEQQMQEQITALQAELDKKRLRLSEAGSIAEAALSVTNVFSAAQAAADLYLHEISCMRENAEKECAKIIEDARKAAGPDLPDSEKTEISVRNSPPAEQSKLRKISRLIRRWTK